MFRRLAVTLTILAVTGSVASTAGAAQPTTGVAHTAKAAPNVRCMRLDRAKKKLYMAGFNVRVRGGGLFGVVNESGWVVTSQSTRGGTVTVYAGRSC